MEVHHPKLEKKNIKEYLLEGLMIFIAVSLGFFAESLREHIRDSSKEHGYIVSLRQDLVDDTATIDIFIAGFNKRILDFDSLINYLRSPGEITNGANMYYLARLATRGTVFGDDNNTLTQLNSSGNFNFISNKEVAKNIVKYQNQIENYKEVHDIDAKEASDLYTYEGALFDAFIFNDMTKSTVDTGSNPLNSLAFGYASVISRPNGNPQLINHDAEKINALVYQLHQRKSTFVLENWLLYEQKKQAKKIIELIDKEY